MGKKKGDFAINTRGTSRNSTQIVRPRKHNKYRHFLWGSFFAPTPQQAILNMTILWTKKERDNLFLILIDIYIHLLLLSVVVMYCMINVSPFGRVVLFCPACSSMRSSTTILSLFNSLSNHIFLKHKPQQRVRAYNTTIKPTTYILY